jgi:hypothetical protein
MAEEPSTTPRSSLKDVVGAPFPVYAQAMEDLAKDSFGVGLVVADADKLKKDRNPEDVEAYRRELQGQIEQKINNQLEKSGSSPSDLTSAKAAGQVYAEELSRRSAENDGSLDAHGNKVETGAGFSPEGAIPQALKAKGVDVQVVGLSSGLTPHLQSPDEKTSPNQCDFLSYKEEREAELGRAHAGYHEFGHAMMNSKHNGAPSSFIPGPWSKDGNLQESGADAFATAMLIRDHGEEGLAYGKKIAADKRSFQKGNDTDHYTAPSVLQVIDQAEKGDVDFKKMSPQDILKHSEGLADKNALTRSEAGLLPQIRNARTNGYQVGLTTETDDKDANKIGEVFNQISNRNYTLGLEAEKGLEQSRPPESTESQKARGERICNAGVAEPATPAARRPTSRPNSLGM